MHLRIAIGVVLLIVAAIAIQSHFKTLDAALDKTADSAAQSFGGHGK